MKKFNEIKIYLCITIIGTILKTECIKSDVVNVNGGKCFTSFHAMDSSQLFRKTVNYLQSAADVAYPDAKELFHRI